MIPKKIFAIAILTILATSIFTVTVPPAVVEAQDQGLFDITIVAPGTANLLRRQWGLIIANAFQSVGINAKVVFLDWSTVYDRILLATPENQGKTWEEGGWDALLIGWTPGAFAFSGSYQVYYSKHTPPNQNYFLWNNATSDSLMEEFMTKGYTAEGIEAFKRWQLVQFEDVPASQIFYETPVLVADPALDFNGYEWLFDNIGPEPEYLEGRPEVVFASTGELLDLNPLLSNSWYDTIVFNPVFESLFTLDQGLNAIPQLATSYSLTPDGRTFTYNLRHGVKFHDGIEMTADDVVFTFLGILNPETASQFSAFYAGWIGEDITFRWLNGTTTRLVLDLENNLSYYPAPPEITNPRTATIEAVDQYTVRVTIADFGDTGKPAAVFHPEADTAGPLYIIPKHVLEQVPFAEWKTHPFNTGVGSYESNGQTFYGPIGTGPYVFKGFDPVLQLATLQKFDQYWDKANLEAQGLYEVNYYYIRYIVEKDAAISALKNGEVHILDQNYLMQRDYLAGKLDFASVYPLPGSGMQQLGYNMRHPIFGTGVATPLGQQDPSRAAEAARYVRQAFDYLIPRSLIISSLMGGMGDPAAVHVNPLSPYYNDAIVPRDYDPDKAKELLAMAGYEVTITPPSPTAFSNYLLGQSIVFTGTFSIDAVKSIEEGGIVVLLEASPDNATWTPVAQAITTTGGYYSITYTPDRAGVFYFRVVLTGVGAKTAAASSYTGPDYPYEGITPAVDSQTSPSVRITVSNLDDATALYRYAAFGGLALAVIALIAVAYVGRKK
jgi:ABC-type transport system substrate-binding protein